MGCQSPWSLSSCTEGQHGDCDIDFLGGALGLIHTRVCFCQQLPGISGGGCCRLRRGFIACPTALPSLWVPEDDFLAVRSSAGEKSMLFGPRFDVARGTEDDNGDM
eukprot:CAMPEP_0114305302 /NCGR_PEP_ID=MMETSP0059-20121206/16264_1 /TAXON_ID=36894 /ORGANISM="Pyramimonas parkeae, Strain CCMP726" /LENGTH=105 /DNA_ID=CAMNT_0001428491 /DNA_START=85 /DNA_END=402 /DNA_ORIENTATION=+